MAVITCIGIELYDPRHTVKAIAAENLLMGVCCYIGDDGLVYAIDDNFSAVCHGITLKAYDSGERVTLLTQARIRVGTAMTPGDMLYTGAETAADPNGSAPQTISGSGVKCGFAITSTKLFVHVNFPPDADTENI